MINFNIYGLVIILLSISLGFVISYWIFKRRVASLKNLAFSDDLGIYNHRELKSKLKSILKNPSIKSFVFVLIDIDRFKNFNDNYGYDKADILLQEFVNITKGFIRKSDLFFRYKNGDEFVIIFNNIGIKEAQEVGNRLRRVIANNAFELNNQQVNLTISMGITSSFKNDSADNVRKRAEVALQEAKQSKNTVVLIEE
ncbi:MAG: GGDEF domain-containing protein [Bacteroidales bacterium]|jgi:diguanylate cyclase (GGDEF)-like protein|nr:GGDEF domain-containing protein [Bacteroidales bacterium]